MGKKEMKNKKKGNEKMGKKEMKNGKKMEKK